LQPLEMVRHTLHENLRSGVCVDMFARRGKRLRPRLGSESVTPPRPLITIMPAAHR
jgi:hypothetical protein